MLSVWRRIVVLSKSSLCASIYIYNSIGEREIESKHI
jgi:hypothetical protein